MRPPETVTEAQNQGQFQVIRINSDATYSNARVIPYAERYRGYTGVMETPIQNLQKAAIDEAKRRAKR